MAINFISSKDNGEEPVMHSQNNNTEIMTNGKGDEVIEELYQSLLSRYENWLETSMRGSDFIFDCFHLLYYKCHKINFKQVRSNIDSPDLIKNKKVNLINKKGSKCFQCPITGASNHEKTKKTGKE